jgi:hypothetical protein
MGTLVIVSFLLGAVLGQILKWPVLYPPVLLAIVLVLVKAAVQSESNLLGLLLQGVAVITSLQLGYAGGGLAASYVRHLQGVRDRSRRSGSKFAWLTQATHSHPVFAHFAFLGRTPPFVNSSVGLSVEDAGHPERDSARRDGQNMEHVRGAPWTAEEQ